MEDKVTRLVGREVYSTNGVFIGNVDDVQLDINEKTIAGLALGGVNQELFEEEAGGGKGIIIPYRWVSAVGDIVIIKDVVEQVKARNENEA